MTTVVIVTPIYATQENNRLGLFGQTERSVLRQQTSGFNIVHVVVDDGSTVDVQACLKEYKDPRIRYLRRQRQPTDLKTASNALNFGINGVLDGDSDLLTKHEAKDLYALAFLHSDDILPSDSLVKRLAGIKEGFVYTDMVFFNYDGKIGNRRKCQVVEKDMLAKTNFFSFNHHTLMWSVKFLEYLRGYVQQQFGQVGIFDPNLFCGEDADASLSSFEAALEKQFPITYVPFASLYYRHHPGSITGHLKLKEAKQQLRIVMDKHPGAISTKPSLGYLQRLMVDLPWSFLTFMPEESKKKLRPLRDFIKGAIAEGTEFGENKYLEELLSESTQ